MGIVRPISDRMYTAPDTGLAAEIAAHPVDARPMIRDGEESEPGDTVVTADELAAEYATLVSYADALSAAGGEVMFTSAEIVRADGVHVADPEAVTPADWPRALLTAALSVRALRKAVREAEAQFIGLLWTARGQAEPCEPEGDGE